MLCAVTPYLMPQPTSKIANLGDGFIVRAIERLLGKFPPALTFTSRALPASEQISQMQKCSWVILAGANQLTDDFTVWPGFDGAALARTGLRLAPMGIGIHGEPRRNAGMTAATRAILAQIHERLDNSSWRCPRTVDYLERSLPHLRGRFLMTGCPVLYAKPLLNESRFGRSEDTVAVTSTERGDFWKREAATIEFVARRFSASRRLMVIHQDYARAAAEGKLRRKLSSLF